MNSFKYSNQVLYNANSLELLKEFEPKSFDIILTDPPYSIGQAKRKTKVVDKNGSHEVDLDFGEWDLFENKDDFINFTKQWVGLAHNLLKNDGVFVSFFSKNMVTHLHDILIDNDLKIKNICAICKKNPMPNVTTKNWNSGWEVFVIATQGDYTFNTDEGMQKDWFDVPTLLGSERYNHPCQKPLSVIKAIMRWWTKPEDLILDPFAGTSTTLVAAYEMGRRAVGIEMSEEYFELSKQRILKETAQEKLF